MPKASRVHLVRHGEVHNPDQILYGRIDGFGLSENGLKMAKAAAKYVKDQGGKVSRVISSPLQRTIESSQPFTDLYGVSLEIDNRLIEPWNHFEGKTMDVSTLAQPKNLRRMLNPLKPSWGEPYKQVRDRMLDIISEVLEPALGQDSDGKFGDNNKASAKSGGRGGDIVLVSHQMPIWMIRCALAGRRLPHNPKNRELDLSSVTTVELSPHGLVEVSYASPAFDLINVNLDLGAV